MYAQYNTTLNTSNYIFKKLPKVGCISSMTVSVILTDSDHQLRWNEAMQKYTLRDSKIHMYI